MTLDILPLRLRRMAACEGKRLDVPDGCDRRPLYSVPDADGCPRYMCQQCAELEASVAATDARLANAGYVVRATLGYLEAADVTLAEDVRQRSQDIRAMLRQWAAEDATRPSADEEWRTLRADLERDRLSDRPRFASGEP